MEIRVLGPLEVVADDGPADLGGPRQRAVLAALAAHHPDPVPPDRLVHAVWDGEPPPSAGSTLRGYLSVLRRELEPDRRDGAESGVLPRVAGGYVLAVDAKELDAWLFEDAVRRARELRDATALDDAAETYRDGLALWRGGPYQDFAYAEFARAEVTRLEELRLTCAEELFEVELALGHHGGVVADIEAHCTEHPMREHARGLLMTALYRCGRQADALRAYEDGRIRLRDELGVDPSPALQERYSAILDQSEPPAPAPTRGGRSRARHGNVPRRRSSFVGRGGELDQVAAALGPGRLVTLTGPGGVGKTRLALEVASRTEGSYPDGAWVCELDAADGDQDVVQTVAGTLRVQRVGQETMTDRIVAVLREREMLLVLDNCEHVLDAAADLVDRVLASGADVAVLVTSRERLGVEGEIVHAVPPLAVAADERAGDSAAERLFLERAQAARPGLRVDGSDRDAVADICRWVDGVPLSIELAAARMAVLGPAEVLAQLVDGNHLLRRNGDRGPERHRSLDAAVEWSYALLSDAEQQTFERLSVFVGGFELDAAAAVIADLDVDTIEMLSSLVGKSMVTVSADGPRTRYGMLETLRRFAADRLEARGATEVAQAARAGHFLRQIERLISLDLDELLDPVDACTRDLPNIRAAVSWAVTVGDVDRAVPMMAGMWPLLIRNGGLGSLARTVHAMPGAESHPEWPGLLAVMVHAAWGRGDLVGAESMATEALASVPDENDRRRILPLAELGIVYLFQGRLREGVEVSEAAAAIARRHDARGMEFVCLGNAVLCHLYLGDTATALDLIEQTRSLADERQPLFRVLGGYREAEVLSAIDPDRALAALEDVMAAAQEADLPFQFGTALTSAASLQARQGHTERALELFADLIDHQRLNAQWVQQWTGLRNLAELFGRIGFDEDALVLLTAGQASDSAPPTFGEQGERLAVLESELDRRMGPGAATAARERARRLTDQETVRYALDAIDRALEDAPYAG